MKLKEYLKSKGITQEQLGQKIGQPRHVINEVVNGKRPIGKKLAAKIYEAIGGELSIEEIRSSYDRSQSKHSE